MVKLNCQKNRAQCSWGELRRFVGLDVGHFFMVSPDDKGLFSPLKSVPPFFQG